MKIIFDESKAIITVSRSELRDIEHLTTWGMFALDFSSIKCSKTEKDIVLELLSVGKAMQEGKEGNRE